MREYFSSESFNHYDEVQAQLVFFVIAYIVYLDLRSLLKTAVIVIAFLWFDEKFLWVSPWVAALLGLLIGGLTTRSSIIHPQCQQASVKLIQVLVLPVILVYLSPLYVDQTDFPVGIILSLISWLGIALLVSGVDASRHAITYIPVVAIFVSSLLFFWLPWVPLLCSFTLSLMVLLHRYQLKSDSVEN